MRRAEKDSANDFEREALTLSSPLSIETGDDDEDRQQQQHSADTDDALLLPGGGDNNNNNNPHQVPLDDRILDLIASIPDRTIRPGRLAAELGLSVEDASAELCGLMAAVGSGASFRFAATSSTSMTMVFTFPPDFAQRARRKRRQQTRREMAWQALLWMVKVLKLVTAFGLILSLLIVSIAALMALVAALIVLSRSGQVGGSSRQHHSLLQQVRLLFYSIRQLLFFYALFGPTESDDNGDPHHPNQQQQQDPFLREVAYDVALLCSVCCGNPGSIFYWMRMNQLQQRRHRMFRGWAHSSSSRESNRDRDGYNHDPGVPSHIPGVTLVGATGAVSATDEPHRGLLSVAVEFLFGPTPFTPGPTEAEKWVLRSAAIMQLCNTSSTSEGVALEDLAPYVDDPPASPHDTNNRMVVQGLMMVAHFNGLPATTATTAPPTTTTPTMHADLLLARFVFPELMAESAVATRYENISETATAVDDDDDDGTWQAMLYNNKKADERTRTGTRSKTTKIPSYLIERRYRFTQLTLQQLLHCLVLGTLNWLGVMMMHQSLAPGGLLQLPAHDPNQGWTSAAATLIRGGLLPVLHFYARLFFVVPCGRLALVLALNRRRTARNQRRARLAVGPRATLGISGAQVHGTECLAI